jgi:pyruvate,orthophosphate dikinase
MAVSFAGKTRIVAAGKQEDSMKVPEADRGVREEAASAKKFVYGFLEDPEIDDVRSLLGGKGAGIREMRKLGFPVPEGFTITTEACTFYIQSGELPESLMDDVKSHMALVEEATDRAFGSPVSPLLVSVRSGASVSMPGMMDTVLNLGLNDETVRGLAERTGDERFAYDSYRRFIQAFGEIVLKVPGHIFEEAIEEAKNSSTGSRPP